jgi:alpha-glucosidase
VQFRDEPSPAPDVEYRYFRDSTYHLNRAATVEILREVRAVVDAYPDRLLIGEMTYHATIDQLVSFVADAGIDLPTNFSLITLPFAPDQIAAHVDAYDKAVVAGGAWPNYCIGNHDMPRVSAHGPQRARLALLLLLTLRGTPFLYYGDEIGMANVEVPPDRRDDRWSVPQHRLTRDSVRTPMQWDASLNGGFCPPDVTPWLPVADDHEQVNVAVETADDQSLLHMIRRLLALRADTPALAQGSYRRITDAPDDCLAYIREHEGQQLAVVLNFGDDPVAVDLPASPGDVVFSTRRSPACTDRSVRLEARAGAVIGLT